MTKKNAKGEGPSKRPGVFGRNLLTYRQRAGLTQEQLADAAKVSRATITNLELGDVQSPSGETGDRLAAALKAKLPKLELADLYRDAAPEMAEVVPITPPERRLTKAQFIEVAANELGKNDLADLDDFAPFFDKGGLTLSGWFTVLNKLRVRRSLVLPGSGFGRDDGKPNH